MSAFDPLQTFAEAFYNCRTNDRSIGLLAFGFIAVVFTWRLGGFFGIAALAMLAAALTMGLRTGTLAPYYPHR